MCSNIEKYSQIVTKKRAQKKIMLSTLGKRFGPHKFQEQIDSLVNLKNQLVFLGPLAFPYDIYFEDPQKMKIYQKQNLKKFSLPYLLEFESVNFIWPTKSLLQLDKISQFNFISDSICN